MSYYAIGLNRFNMYAMGGFYGFNSPAYYNPFGGCCASYSPFMAYGFNQIFNPFNMFNTSMELMGYDTRINPTYSSFQAYSPYSFQMMPAVNIPSGDSLFSTSYYQAPQQTPTFGDFSTYSTLGNDVNLVGMLNDYTQPKISESERTEKKEEKPKSSFGAYTIPKDKKSRQAYSLYALTSHPTYTKLEGTQLNNEFLEKTKQVAKNLNCDFEDLLAVMNSECSLKPNEWNDNKTAVGLIQFTDLALADLKRVYGINLTKNDIAKMPALEQLDLVEKYLKITTKKFNGKKLSAADLYASVYLPARAKKELLATKGERKSNGKLLNYYESNKGLDFNGDDKITKTDLAKHLAKKRVSLETFA